jgi:DNA-binding MarR family transcriptional regulator
MIHTRAGAGFTDLVLEVFRLNGAALEAGNRLAAPAGLTSARWQVLGVVDHGPAPASNVARTMGLTRQSVQQTSDVLRLEGFIDYADNPHHRKAKLIVITPAGREALRKVEARQIEWSNRIGAALGPAQMQEAVEILRQARQLLEQDDALDKS